MNIKNTVMLQGNVLADPTFFDHKDGSKTVYLKLGVRDNFKSKNVKQRDGSVRDDYATNFITVQGYIPAKAKNPNFPLGVYGLIEVGMPIGVIGHLASYVVEGGATNKAGEKVNRWEQCVRIDQVQLLETKDAAAVRRNRQAKATGTPAASAAPAPSYGSDEGVADFDALGADM